MINVISMKFKRNTFNMLKSIDQLNYLEKRFNKINLKILEKEFLDILKSQTKSKEVKDDSNEEIQVIKVKINLKKFIKTNEEILDDYFSEWVEVINKKNILSLLINALTLRKKQKEYEELVNKNKIIEALKKKQELLSKQNKRKKELIIRILVIRNKIYNKIIKQYFNQWKKTNYSINIDNSNNIYNFKNINISNNFDKNNNINNLKNINILNNIDKSNNNENPINLKNSDNIDYSSINNIINSNINNINTPNYFNNSNNIYSKKNNISKNNKRTPKKNSKKKRIVKRNNLKKKNKKKNDIIKVMKKINNEEKLRNIIHRWKNNADNLKINEDYKHILNSIKKQNKDNSEEKEKINNNKNENKNISKYENVNIELLDRLKKVSLHLLLSRYQKRRDSILKKYLNIWKSNIVNIIRKKKKTLIKQISKYIKKKVGSCIKKKENGNQINKDIKENIINKTNNITKYNEKTFSKKKTKLNLYKEKINHYKNFVQKMQDNNNVYSETSEKLTSETKNIILENTPQTKKIKKEKYVVNKISNYTEPRYIIKKPGRRNYSQNRYKYRKIIDNDYYNMNEKTKQPYISKSTEKNYNVYKKKNNDLVYFNLCMENLTEYTSDYKYSHLADSKDKITNINLLKTLSSQDESTSNHISLLEEANEIRKPKKSINLSIQNKKSYFSPGKAYNILSPQKILTDRRQTKSIKQKKESYDYMKLIPYSCQTITETKQYPLRYNEIDSTYLINEGSEKNNNIYLYQNERESQTYGKYLTRPQYFYNYDMKCNDLNDFNSANTVKINPLLYERMIKKKMTINNGYFSPFSRKVIKDNNKIKVIYNRDNYNFSDNEDFSNITKYGNEEGDNNYFRNDFY